MILVLMNRKWARQEVESIAGSADFIRVLRHYGAGHRWNGSAAGIAETWLAGYFMIFNAFRALWYCRAL